MRFTVLFDVTIYRHVCTDISLHFAVIYSTFVLILTAQILFCIEKIIQKIGLTNLKCYDKRSESDYNALVIAFLCFLVKLPLQNQTALKMACSVLYANSAKGNRTSQTG